MLYMICRIAELESRRLRKDFGGSFFNESHFVSESLVELRGRIEDSIMNNCGLTGQPLIPEILVRHIFIYITSWIWQRQTKLSISIMQKLFGEDRSSTTLQRLKNALMIVLADLFQVLRCTQSIDKLKKLSEEVGVGAKTLSVLK